MLLLVSSILDPKHPLSGADPESYFNLHMIPPGYQPIEEGDYSYQTQYNQAGEDPQPWSADHICKENSNIKPMEIEAHQPLLEIDQEEINYDFKLMAPGPCWHCPSLLSHGS